MGFFWYNNNNSYNNFVMIMLYHFSNGLPQLYHRTMRINGWYMDIRTSRIWNPRDRQKKLWIRKIRELFAMLRSFPKWIFHSNDFCPRRYPYSSILNTFQMDVFWIIEAPELGLSPNEKNEIRARSLEISNHRNNILNKRSLSV